MPDSPKHPRVTGEGGLGSMMARCSAWWPLFVFLDRVLTKFALSPGPKLAGLEWAALQKTSWAWCTARRLGSKCLYSPASQSGSVFMLGVLGGGNDTFHLSSFLESSSSTLRNQ